MKALLLSQFINWTKNHKYFLAPLWKLGTIVQTWLHCENLAPLCKLGSIVQIHCALSWNYSNLYQLWLSFTPRKTAGSWKVFKWQLIVSQLFCLNIIYKIIVIIILLIHVYTDIIYFEIDTRNFRGTVFNRLPTFTNKLTPKGTAENLMRVVSPCMYVYFKSLILFLYLSLAFL